MWVQHLGFSEHKMVCWFPSTRFEMTERVSQKMEHSAVLLKQKTCKESRSIYQQASKAMQCFNIFIADILQSHQRVLEWEWLTWDNSTYFGIPTSHSVWILCKEFKPLSEMQVANELQDFVLGVIKHTLSCFAKVVLQASSISWMTKEYGW